MTIQIFIITIRITIECALTFENIDNYINLLKCSDNVFKA